MASLQIRVTVHATDPLTRAGTLSHLRHEPGLEVIEPTGLMDTRSVALVVLQRLDDATSGELRRLTRDPLRRVVLVADQLREPELLAVLGLGVSAIIWRNEATPSRLVRAIRAAARGDRELPQDLLGQLIAHVNNARRAGTHTSPNVPAAGFAPRELDVLKLIAEGFDNQEIATKLSYSERTIKNVLHGLMTRFQLRNRAHAVAYALREGYI
jgi:DNA-binding NarL/FixJ family response regulator